MSLQDLTDNLIDKLKVFPSLSEYIEYHELWVDCPVEQLSFYSKQIVVFLDSLQDRLLNDINLAGAVLLGANRLITKSIGQNKGYFCDGDLALTFELSCTSLKGLFTLYIQPVLASKDFKQKFKQWKMNYQKLKRKNEGN